MMSALAVGSSACIPEKDLGMFYKYDTSTVRLPVVKLLDIR